MILYHYTTKSGYENITRTGQFARSSPFTTMDSAYGDGWYFTDLDMEKCDPAILSHCWKNVSATDRIQCYLKFEISDSIVIRCREHVFMVSAWIEQHIKYLGGGVNRVCSAKPCHTCEKGKKYYT